MRKIIASVMAMGLAGCATTTFPVSSSRMAASGPLYKAFVCSQPLVRQLDMHDAVQASGLGLGSAFNNRIAALPNALLHPEDRQLACLLDMPRNSMASRMDEKGRIPQVVSVQHLPLADRNPVLVTYADKQTIDAISGIGSRNDYCESLYKVQKDGSVSAPKFFTWKAGASRPVVYGSLKEVKAAKLDCAVDMQKMDKVITSPGYRRGMQRLVRIITNGHRPQLV